MVQRDQRILHLNPSIVRKPVTVALHDQLPHLFHEARLVDDAIFLILRELQACQSQGDFLQVAIFSQFHEMVDEFLLLQEPLAPITGVVELFLCKFGLAWWRSPLEGLKLLIRVQVLAGCPLHELLVVNFASHWNLEVSKGFLSSLNGHGWEVRGWEAFSCVAYSTFLRNFQHIIDEVEHCLNQGS